MDRKNYSITRETALRRVVQDGIDDFRRRALAGEFSRCGGQERDALIQKALGPIVEAVAAEYRRHYVPGRGNAYDDRTGYLFALPEEVAA
jgi:hypothetical protein